MTVAKVYTSSWQGDHPLGTTILELSGEGQTLTIVMADSEHNLPQGGEAYDVQTECLLGERRSDVEFFGRMVAGHYHTEKIDEAVRVSRAILPLVRDQKGFVGVFLFTKLSGENFSVSIWEHEEDSKFNIEVGWFEEQVAKFDGLYCEQPSRSSYRLHVRSSQ